MISKPNTFKLIDHKKSKQWSEKNKIDINKISLYSRKKCWFKCNICDHNFLTIVGNFIRSKNGCSYCANKYLCENDNCKICFQKSLASSPKSKILSLKNKINPRQIFKGSDKKLWFYCKKCNHDYKQIIKTSNGCPYCKNYYLCNSKNCNYCFNKSFISNEKSKYWNIEKNNKNPRELFKNNTKKFWFNCDKCKHSFKQKLNDIIQKKTWCPYCSHTKLCKIDECIECFNKSFASHPKSKYWSDKNKKKSNEVFLNSQYKGWFNCGECNLEFKRKIHHINTGNLWCPNCNSTHLETCMKSILKKLNIKYEEQKRFWLNNINWISYDFYLPKYNILIEMDGLPHFKYTKFFHKNKKKFREHILRDIMKNYFALKNGYKILRISYFDDDYIDKYLLFFINNNFNIYFSNRKLYKNIYSNYILNNVV